MARRLIVRTARRLFLTLGCTTVEASVAVYSERVALAVQPVELIRAAVALNLSLQLHCGDIIHATRAAGAVDSTLAEVYAEGTQPRDSGIRMVIDRLHAAGVLRPELELRQAVGLFSPLCSFEAFADWAARHDWTADQCETWTVDALCRLLLT